MRLTCPNCGAQYEIPDEVIPEPGRDVQCSNCGDTWFQHHPNHMPTEDMAGHDNSGWQDEAPPPPPEPEAPEQESEPEPEYDLEDEDPDGWEDAEPEFEDAPTARRELDPDVSGVLREEAEREQAAREAEYAEGLETQTELGLDPQDAGFEYQSSEEDREARLRELQSEDDASEDLPAEPDPGDRSNLLPDIDEINSSLDSDSNDAAMTEAELQEQSAPPRSSFRSGFRLMALLALVGLLLYVFAPQLADAVPAMKPTLESYVQLVNEGRVWLAQTVASIMG